jgi:hypothetical protein
VDVQEGDANRRQTAKIHAVDERAVAGYARMVPCNQLACESRARTNEGGLWDMQAGIAFELDAAAVATPPGSQANVVFLAEHKATPSTDDLETWADKVAVIT